MGERTKDVLLPTNIAHPFNALTNRLKEKFLAFFQASSTIEEQTILKELTQCIETSEEKKLVALSISHMYLMISSKHPLKKTCTRILLSMDADLVKTAIAFQVKDFIGMMIEKRSGKAEVNLEDEKIEDVFITIMHGLFGNFPPGIEALNKIIDVVFLYAFEVVVKDLNFLESDAVPLDVAQQMLYNSTKFLDTLLHHCDMSFHLPQKSINLLMTSYTAIRHEKISFNTKAHFGALLVMAVVQCPDNLDEKELNDLSALLRIPQLTPDDNLLTATLQSCTDCYTTRICIFSGIVHTCPLHVMSKYMVDDTPVAIYIFKNMLEIAKKRSSIATEILEISRTLVSLSPLISNIKIQLLADMMKNCWDYIWMHLDHFVDAVRTDSQKLLKTFITITLELTVKDKDDGTFIIADSDNLYLQMFTSAISEIIQGQNPNFKALAHIASAMKCQILLDIFPKLPRSLLDSLGNSSVAQDVCVAYERLMEQHKKEMPETWIDTWVKPILPLKHPDHVIAYVLKIFNTAFKLNSEVVLLISGNCIYPEPELRALLGCIITARKSNLKLDKLLSTKNGNSSWNGICIFNENHLQMLLCHQSSEIRILVLTLLIECQKTTEMFTLDDLKLFIMFFRYNSSSPFPNFRQNMTALYKKALNRFKDSFYVIQRTIRNEEARGCEGNADKLKQFKNFETYYKEFVVTFFHQQLLRGLYHQAEHGKRAMCLELLIHLKSCVPEDLYNEQWRFPDLLQILFGALEDTYESNLILVRKLILELPKEIVFPEEYMKEFELLMKRYILQITYDVKPNVTTSATYAILVYIRSPAALPLIQKNFSIQLDGETCPALLIQRELAAQINTELDVAKKDILMAAKYAPIYGLLFCLRHLIQKETIDKQHPNIIPNMISQCLEVVELASPIVNSSAPEGYNPNNVDYEKADVTPQLVLLYAWRTIKEVSLLFGELQINDPNVKEILKRDNILDSMSKYFIELFESAKHRGAYEQGYVGFSKFTEKLWNSDCDWSKLPEQWLENTLKLITSTDANICATRRSAGIPFMIQGLLITEPKSRANKSFHYCMQYLLQVAENYSVENQTSAIHSMNILRALYRHNQLGEVVASYVSKGVMIAITQFSHKDWAIRNSATLMFAALMMRMFGVQRLKDCEKISIKNRLSFKVFITRYPDLYKFLFEKLDEYVADTKENVSLYPVLVVLGRIYITYDAKMDNNKLIAHLHSLLKATSRTIYKIRELAVIAAVTFNSFLNENISIAKSTNNQIHGYLLQLKHQVRGPQARKFTLNYFKPLLILIMEAGKGVSQTCSTLLMDILIDFLKTYEYKDEDLDTYKQLLSHLHINQESTISTCARFPQTKFTLYLHVILKMSQGQCYKSTFIASALLRALDSRNEDLNIYALNCIRYLSSDKVKEPETRELEYDFVNTMSTQTKGLLSYMIRVHLIKGRTFIDLFDILRNRSHSYALKVCQVLYNYPLIVYTIRPLLLPVKLNHQIILDYLDQQATSISSEMFVAILGLISKFVAGSNETLHLESLIHHMVEYGSDDSTAEERLAIANFLLKNYNLLINQNAVEEKLRLKLWNIYLDLIQDDEYIVRDFCNQISFKILSASNTSELNERYLKRFPLIPERLHEDVLSRLPTFIGRNHALKIYATLSLQYEEIDIYPDEATVFDKNRPNTFKESRPYAPQAKHYLSRNLWTLDHGLSYENKTIFLEEHFLLVATKLLNVISQQDETEDRCLCIMVLKNLIKYLEGLKIGSGTTVDDILENFVRFFNLAVAEDRTSTKEMCACVIEASQFLTSVLFTCREHESRDECKCDNL